MSEDLFEPYIRRWDLTPDGARLVTPRAQLLPVCHAGEPAILKVATEPEEKFGGVLLTWWNGVGAAKVRAADGDALLLERACGPNSLVEYARNDRDDEATQIICDVIAKLHEPRATALPVLVPLKEWFAALAPGARRYGGFIATASKIADQLLAEQEDVRPLHGDIHHANILDFGPRGWLAIDPKRVIGDRAYDYANLFCNPDMDEPVPPVAVLPDRFARRLEIVVDRSEIERARLLRWIVAYTGLSATWCLDDSLSAEVDLAVGTMALAALNNES